MPRPSKGKCHHCGAEVQWAINRETGVKAPLDPEPDMLFGNLLVDEYYWTFVKLDPPMVERAINRGFDATGKPVSPLYVNHLSMCQVLNQKAS